MLLAIDIGNSSTKIGRFDRTRLVSRSRIPTDRRQTAGQLAESLAEQLTAPVAAVVVASVVPELNDAYRELFAARFAVAPVFVDNAFDFGLEILYEPPTAAGADRLVAAGAACAKYGAPVVVCDFGTATTIDLVTAAREYAGGVIAPGPQTLADALHLKTSKLPRVAIARPPRAVGRTTVECIRSGVFYGYVGLTEGLLRRVIAESGARPRVVATGGFAALIAADCELIEVVDENLMLEGLRMVYERQ